MMFDRKTHWQNIYQTRSPLDVGWYQKEQHYRWSLSVGDALEVHIVDFPSIIFSK